MADATVRAADLVSLEQIAAEYPSRERFLTELTLDPPDATSDEAGPPRRDEDGDLRDRRREGDVVPRRPRAAIRRLLRTT